MGLLSELLSTPSEWHSLVLGLGAGSYAAARNDFNPIDAAIAIALGNRATTDGHLSDIRQEEAYFAAGAIVGYAIGSIGVHHHFTTNRP